MGRHRHHVVPRGGFWLATALCFALAAAAPTGRGPRRKARRHTGERGRKATAKPPLEVEYRWATPEEFQKYFAGSAQAKAEPTLQPPDVPPPKEMQRRRVSADMSGELPGGQALDLSILRPAQWSNDYDRPACELPAASGRFTGVCAEQETLQESLKFCRDSVPYRACAPALAARCATVIGETKGGRYPRIPRFLCVTLAVTKVPAHQPLFPSWNFTQKDALLGTLFKSMVEDRMARELNVTPDIYVEIRLLTNPECAVALRNMLCWYNFPKCSDDNVSLPLCRSSCETFYTACRYSSSLGDGKHEECTDSMVSTSGLFRTGVINSDQVLREDTIQCNSTAEEANAIHVDESGTMATFISSPRGIILTAVICVLLLYLTAYFFLVPGAIRAKINSSIRSFVMLPVRLWKQRPAMRGRTLLYLFFITFFFLLAIGLYRRMFRYSLAKFIAPEEISKEDWQSTLDQHGSDMSADQLKRAENMPLEDEVFVPVGSVHEVPTQQVLTNLQRRQLISSCSCTGAARRGSGGSGGAMPIAPLLALLTTWWRSRDE